MEVIKTYKFKLYKSKKNRYLDDLTNVSGIIWNHCIALQKSYYRLYRKSLHKYQLEKHITKISKLKKFIHFRLVGNAARSNIIKRIDESYRQFFRNVKKGTRTSPPGFKKVKKYKSFSFRAEGDGWKLLEGNKIRIRGKVFSYFKSREVKQDAKSLTVKRDGLGDFYIHIVAAENIDIPERQGKSFAGFDFGLKTFLTLDDGSEIQSPLFFKSALLKTRRLNKMLSSKVKGSGNWNKAKIRLAKHHKDISNKRRHWFYQLSHKLTNKYDALFFEDLNINGMMRMWGRKVSDLGFAEFLKVLNFVATKKGVYVGKVDKWFPSTKTCSECGTSGHNLSLSDRVWACPDCGATHDRDVNAAKNIKREGASSLRLGKVRPRQGFSAAEFSV